VDGKRWESVVLRVKIRTSQREKSRDDRARRASKTLDIMTAMISLKESGQ
jgi:hypothetical protein